MPIVPDCLIYNWIYYDTPFHPVGYVHNNYVAIIFDRVD